LDNISLLIFENRQEISFSSPGHLEELFIWVLDGQLSFAHGPVVETGEAFFIAPDLPYTGKYKGKLLMVRCKPEKASQLDPDVMNRIIKPEELEFIVGPSGARFMPLAISANVSIAINERGLGGGKDTQSPPEKEIAYVLQGQVTFKDGRVVRAGEATFNFSNVPHAASYSNEILTKVLEVKSPPDPKFSKFKP
jgi:hypothetical protein